MAKILTVGSDVTNSRGRASIRCRRHRGHDFRHRRQQKWQRSADHRESTHEDQPKLFGQDLDHTLVDGTAQLFDGDSIRLGGDDTHPWILTHTTSLHKGEGTTVDHGPFHPAVDVDVRASTTCSRSALFVRTDASASAS
ncbi:hypothetical protein PC116_g875 [Phytophthora cactorum]|nr:hypothetical protein PC116_g875 [Phytophthora cactorum]